MTTIKPEWLNPTDPIKPGLLFGQPDCDYQGLPALRWSTLKLALTSPRHFRHALTEPRPDTPALNLGRALHLRVLQPEVYADSVAIVPAEHLTASGAMSRKAPALAWLADAEATAEAVLRPTEAEHVERLARAVAEHGAAAELMRECPWREVTAVWHEPTPAGLIVCKARADLLGPSMLADLKTWSPRSGLSAHAFGREVWSRSYHAQLAWYSRGIEAAQVQALPHGDLMADPSRLGFVVVDKGGPGDVMACTLDADAEEAGRQDAQAAFDALVAALERDEWPGQQPDRVVVSLPRYAFANDNNADDLGLDGLEG